MVAVTVDSIQTGSEFVESSDGTSIDITITSVNTSRSIVMFTTRGGNDGRDTRCLFAASITSSTNINFLRTNSAFANDITIEWTVVEFAASVLTSLQTISADWYTTSSNIITGVNVDESFIVWSRRSNQNQAFNNGEGSYLEFNGAGTAVDVTGLSAANKCIGEAQVLEFDAGVDVQHFVTTIALNTESNTETITSIDTTSSFVSHLGSHITSTVSGSLNRYNPIVELTNATTITLSRNTGGSPDPVTEVSYSVIELQDSQNVEQFNVTISDANTTPTQPSFTAVGSDSAMYSGNQLLPSRGDNSNNGALDDFSVSAALDGTLDGVTLTRVGTTGGMDVEGFVIDFTASGETALVVADNSHGQSSDGLTFTQAHTIAISAADHSHSVNNLVLSQVHNLAITEGAHDVESDNLSLDVSVQLAIEDTAHAHASENLVIAQIHDLSLSEASHGQAADNLLLIQNYNLGVAESVHSQVADNLTLELPGGLNPFGAAHNHAVDNISLSQLHNLIVANSTHGLVADNIDFSFAPEVLERNKLTAHIEDRSIRVSLEDRSVKVTNNRNELRI